MKVCAGVDKNGMAEKCVFPRLTIRIQKNRLNLTYQKPWIEVNWFFKIRLKFSTSTTSLFLVKFTKQVRGCFEKLKICIFAQIYIFHMVCRFT